MQAAVESEWLVPAALTVGLALVHLVGEATGRAISNRLGWGGRAHRRQFLSLAGGASVAYVFVLLLPEISEAALTVSSTTERAFLNEQVVYLLTLTGFVTFYGIETAAVRRSRGTVEENEFIFWAHVGVFAIYGGLVGFLLFHQEESDPLSLTLYAVAMGLHFLVTDAGLHRHHGLAFDRSARWLLAAGTLAGGVVGLLVPVPGLSAAMLLGFLAGALALNVLKEELPWVDEIRFVAFAVGALVFTILVFLG